MSVSLSPCALPHCGYPVGECSGACLAPRSPVPHGLPIDLVEPDEPAPVGDRVPCHVFMPEVPWPAPVGPVIRMRPRRERWLLACPAAAPVAHAPDLLEPDGMGRVAALIVGFWCTGASLLVLASMRGWL
jgi:hypothetical protein